jgi:hypothetical protein
MEQEHPIPQQISAYEFHLVGDMTLKQFFQVAGGAIISLIIYGSSLPSYVKWPLIIVSFLAGVGFAFFPLQDRPLSTWIFLFIKAIYSPTSYSWQKGGQKRQIFQSEEDAVLKSAVAVVPKEDYKPAAVSLPKPEPDVNLQPATVFKPVLQQEVKPDTATGLPQTTPVRVEPGAKPELQSSREAPLQEPSQQMQPDDSLYPMASTNITGAQQAKFSPEAAPPLPPNKENVIVGQVVDAEGKIVEGAILEVKDDEGRPVRALKTNKLGHFMIVTPLTNGSYKIITEKEGLEFDPISFDAEGQIILPIAVWAKNSLAGN